MFHLPSYYIACHEQALILLFAATPYILLDDVWGGNIQKEKASILPTL